MRLGVVGMLPANPAEIRARHLAAIRALRLTGVGLSISARNSPPAGVVQSDGSPWRDVQ